MTTKENYVQQVFQTQLDRYPSICGLETQVPIVDVFELEYVPPQYDPGAVKENDPDFYDKVHVYIINNHLKQYSNRRKKRLEKAMWSVFQELDESTIKYLINKYLMLSGKRHQLSDWAFIGDSRWQQKLKHRMKQIREDMIPVIRTALVGFAWGDQEISNDVLFFMRMLLTGK